MKDTVDQRAVKIAAKILQAAGCCRHQSPTQCRRICPTAKDCQNCIKSWLLAKARQELKREDERSKT